MSKKKVSLLKDSLILSFGTFFSKGIAFFLLPFYTRIFSPADYGVLDLLSVTILIFSFFINWQMEQGVTRFFLAARHPLLKQSYATTGLLHYVVGFSLTAVLIFAFKTPIALLLLGSETYAPIIGIAGFFMLSDALFGFLQNQLKWQLSFKSYAFMTILKVLFNTTLIIYFAGFLDFGVFGVYVGSLSANCLLLGVLLYLTRTSFNVKTISYKRWVQKVKFSSPLIVSSIAMYAMSFTDRFMIRSFLSLEDMGIYSIAARFASTTLILFAGFTQAFGPYVLTHFRDPNFSEVLGKVFTFISFLSGGLFLFFCLFSKDLIQLLTTPEFYGAAQLIPVLIVSTVLYALCIEFSMGIMIGKKNGYFVYIYIIGMFVNAALNWIGIHYFGIIGSALGTMMTMLFIMIVSLSLSNKFMPMLYEIKSLMILPILIGTSLILTAAIPLSPALSFAFRALLLCGYGIISLWLHPAWVSFIKTKLPGIQKQSNG